MLADAAVSVVAQTGLKGLTHRAVDTFAQVPPGTTSNYWRSRRALIEAMATRLEELDVAAWQQLPPLRDLDALVGGLATFIVALAGAHPDLVRVRFALFLDHAERMTPAHERVRALLVEVLERFDVPDAAVRARLLTDLCDGVLLHAVTVRREPVDVEALTQSLRAIVG